MERNNNEIGVGVLLLKLKLNIIFQFICELDLNRIKNSSIPTRKKYFHNE